MAGTSAIGKRFASDPETAQPDSRGSFIVDAHGIVLALDQRMEELTGWRAIEVVGRHKDNLTVQDSAWGNRPSAGARCLYDGALPVPPPSAGFDLRIQCRDGRTLDVEAVSSPLGGAGGRLSIRITHVLARTEAPAADPSALGEHDLLTGLPNRSAFNATLHRELLAAANNASPLALILVDVDHLRRINDKLGRSSGDDVLRKLAGILRAAATDADFVARLGDDDFAVLMIGAGRGEPRQFAARLRSSMQQVRMLRARSGNHPIQITLSIGAASFPTDGDAEEDLMDRAREALAEARSLGRNRVWCYTRRERVRLKTPVYFDGADPLIVGFSRDLSPSGIFIDTPTPIEPGMRCALAFPLPGTEENVHVIGRVVRIVSPKLAAGAAEDAMPGIAVEFESFGSDDRRTIETFLHRFQDRVTPGAKASH